MSEPSTTAELWYGELTIADVVDVFISDGTWFGVIHNIHHEAHGSQFDQIRKFIAFSVDWNERCARAPEAVDPREFDKYRDLTSSGLWFSVLNGVRGRIFQAPVFFAGNEVSWSTVDPE